MYEQKNYAGMFNKFSRFNSVIHQPTWTLLDNVENLATSSSFKEKFSHIWEPKTYTDILELGVQDTTVTKAFEGVILIHRGVHDKVLYPEYKFI